MPGPFPCLPGIATLTWKRLMSVLAQMMERQAVEIGTIGNEGF